MREACAISFHFAPLMWRMVETDCVKLIRITPVFVVLLNVFSSGTNSGICFGVFDCDCSVLIYSQSQLTLHK